MLIQGRTSGALLSICRESYTWLSALPASRTFSASWFLIWSLLQPCYVDCLMVNESYELFAFSVLFQVIVNGVSSLIFISKNMKTVFWPSFFTPTSVTSAWGLCPYSFLFHTALRKCSIFTALQSLILPDESLLMCSFTKCALTWLTTGNRLLFQTSNTGAVSSPSHPFPVLHYFFCDHPPPNPLLPTIIKGKMQSQ